MYDAKITSAEPTLLVILLDQSSSMDTTLVETRGERFSIARMAKYVVDEFLYEAFNKCIREDELKPYLDIAVIGYALGLRSAVPKIPFEQFPFGVITLEGTHTAENPRNPDDTSAVRKPRYEWLTERAHGDTPMLAAFTKAREIIEKWLPDHKTSLPPVVINISDGMPSDDSDIREMLEYNACFGDLSQTSLMAEAVKIRDTGTENGKCLICNCHVSSLSMTQILYPSSSEESVRADPMSELMFQMSSIIPESMYKLGKKLGLPLKPGSRFFVFNADVNTLIKFMKFGTGTATGEPDALPPPADRPSLPSDDAPPSLPSDDAPPSLPDDDAPPSLPP